MAWPQALGERITVVLVPVVARDLRQLRDRTKSSTTDLINRAITSYEFIDAQQRGGRDLLVRYKNTGEAYIVRFV